MQPFASLNKNGRILRFFGFGTPPAMTEVRDETNTNIHGKGIDMSTNNEVFGKVFAAFGAVAMTMTLLVSSFYNAHATTVAGLLA